MDGCNARSRKRDERSRAHTRRLGGRRRRWRRIRSARLRHGETIEGYRVRSHRRHRGGGVRSEPGGVRTTRRRATAATGTEAAREKGLARKDDDRRQGPRYASLLYVRRRWCRSGRAGPPPARRPDAGVAGSPHGRYARALPNGGRRCDGRAGMGLRNRPPSHESPLLLLPRPAGICSADGQRFGIRLRGHGSRQRQAPVPVPQPRPVRASAPTPAAA